MLWRNSDFSCHAARRGATTTARGRVRCAVAISSANLIQSPDDNVTAKLIFEDAINFQKALVKRDQSILRNKKEDSQVSTNCWDWKPKLTMTMTISKGGVEDTRLEAKAKDTKKSEAKNSPSEDRPSWGQGQKCSRPRPRTKDTSASVLQKKKVFKNFFRQSQKSIQKFFQAFSGKNAF